MLARRPFPKLEDLPALRDFLFYTSAACKNLAYFSYKKITWRLNIEMIEGKAFGIILRVYSLFKSERLSSNMKRTLHKAIIGL
jgi:hypothetical protein